MTFCSVIEYGVISFIHRRIERLKKKKPESAVENQKPKERENLKTVYLVPNNNRYCSEQKIWLINNLILILNVFIHEFWFFFWSFENEYQNRKFSRLAKSQEYINDFKIKYHYNSNNNVRDLSLDLPEQYRKYLSHRKEPEEEQKIKKPLMYKILFELNFLFF